ncbi:MAG: hypothetical protein HQK54_16210 [Oligoflexales bacterium]|nr:hypothetical protein [Oligoflexales bacterium]
MASRNGGKGMAEGTKIKKQDFIELYSMNSSVLRLASEHKEPTYLTSSFSPLNTFLEGGVRFGDLIEWGLPPGMCGRSLILSFINESFWTLWALKDGELSIYPPAWEARGVSLSQIRFAYSKEIIGELRPLFINPFFKLIILDSPDRLNNNDLAFLARQARSQGQVIMILREFFLTPRKGNVWARLRVNCWYDIKTSRFFLKVVKGLPCRQTSFPGEP